jgi:hypothetical protein
MRRLKHIGPALVAGAIALAAAAAGRADELADRLRPHVG